MTGCEPQKIPWALRFITKGNVPLHFISSLKYFCSSILKEDDRKKIVPSQTSHLQKHENRKVWSPDLCAVPPLSSRLGRQVQGAHLCTRSGRVCSPVSMASGQQGALSLQLPGDAVLAKGYYTRHHLKLSQQLYSEERGYYCYFPHELYEAGQFQ